MTEFPQVPEPLSSASDEERATLAWLLEVEQAPAELGSAEIARLGDLLGDLSKTIRRHAAAAMTEALRSGVVTTLVCEVLLRDREASRRWGTAFALVRSQRAELSGDVLAEFLAALGNDDGDVRWAAAANLAVLARESSILRDQLGALVGDDDPRRRKMALLCLCEAGAHDGAVYRRALADDDRYVRMAALTGLARSADRSELSLAAIARLERDDADPGVQRAAAAVLRRLQSLNPER